VFGLLGFNALAMPAKDAGWSRSAVQARPELLTGEARNEIKVES